MTADISSNQLTESNVAAMHGGLSNPVMQSQAIFRVIMDAMARPGKVISTTTDAEPPAPLNALAGAILATLADADTPLWLDQHLSSQKSLKDWLTFQVGAPFAVEPSQATFAVLSQADRLPSLEIFAQGEQDYPDRSTTLIIQVEHLSNDPVWALHGPGIKDTAHLSVQPISPLFLGQWADNNSLFPRGVDIILVSSDAIACLPRTTRITDLTGEA